MRTAALILVMATTLVALSSQTGCARIEHKDRQLKLDQAVRLYVDSIRWGNFDTAAALIRPREGSTTRPPEVSVLQNVRVTAYDSRILSVNEAANEATVVTSFDYYFLSTGTVRTVSQSGIWWFDAASGRWFMDGTLPDFRP